MARQARLYAGWSPLDEVGELSLANALQALVHLHVRREQARYDTAPSHAWVGSTSPCMMFRIEMYLLWLKSLLRVWVETMMFLVWRSRRMTSSTVVLRTVDVVCISSDRGVYPVIRKWQRGVGMSDATRPTRSLFM